MKTYLKTIKEVVLWPFLATKLMNTHINTIVAVSSYRIDKIALFRSFYNKIDVNRSQIEGFAL